MTVSVSRFFLESGKTRMLIQEKAIYIGLLCVELVSLIASPRSYAFVVPFRVIAVCGFCIIHSQVKKRFVAGSDRDGFHGREPPRDQGLSRALLSDLNRNSS